jgi:hypothetical protein
LNQNDEYEKDEILQYYPKLDELYLLTEDEYILESLIEQVAVSEIEVEFMVVQLDSIEFYK